MPILHVIIGFDGITDHALEELAGAVSASLYTAAAAYPSPPVTKISLNAALAAFSAAIVTAKAGGPADTAHKNDLRGALIGLLRQLAAYVDGRHGNNLATLLDSGFKAGKTGNTGPSSTPSTATSIKEVVNGLSGQLLPKINSVNNAAGYEARSALIAPDGPQGPWVNGEFSKSPRGLALNGLTPGALYAVQVRVHFAASQHSDWSDTVQHRAL